MSRFIALHRTHPFFMTYAYASLGVAGWVVVQLARIV